MYSKLEIIIFFFFQHSQSDEKHLLLVTTEKQHIRRIEHHINHELENERMNE